MPRHRLLLATLALCLAAACGSGTGAGTDGGGPGGGDGATTDGPIVIIDGGGVVVGGDAGPWTCYPILCT